MENNEIYNILISTHDKKGKMNRMISINTNSLTNPFCIEQRKNTKYICSHCYGTKYLKFRKNAPIKYQKCGDFLSSRLLKNNEIPLINNLYVRFHSFGEIINDIHLKNIYIITKRNPKVNFSLWTKRIEMIEQEKEQKPINLILIQSNPYINNPNYTKHSMFDKLFSVYTKDYVKKNDIKINCQKKCINCLMCYQKNNITNINEIMK